MSHPARSSARLLTACLLALAALPLGCEKKSDPAAARKAPDPVAVSLSSAKQQSVQRSIDVVGTLYGDEEAQLSSKVSGRIMQLMADVGDHVDAGAPLAQIDPVDFELARRSAETALQQSLAKLGLTALPDEKFDPNTVPTVVQARLQAENAEARLGRSEKLFQQDPPLISEQEYADTKTAAQVARAAYDVALLNARGVLAEVRTRQADLAIAERRLVDATIRAPQPTPGSTSPKYAISARLVSVGEYVKDATPLFRVVVDDPIRFRAAVPERYLSEVKLDQAVTIRVEAFADPFNGIVRRINPQIDRESRSFQVEIQVPNPKGQLRSGAFARGSIVTRSEPNVVFIPQEAVVSFAGIRKAFTVKDGKAVERQITTGTRDGNYIEVTSGMDKPEDVVTFGAARLANGIPVTLRPATQPATAAAR